jgi:hypothetical protein
MCQLTQVSRAGFYRYLRGGHQAEEERDSMIVTIREDSIDITEIPLNQHIEWESLLNELKAEHIPGWYQDGKRMGSSIVEGKVHVFIYRTANMPPEAKILEIFKRHGIS